MTNARVLLLLGVFVVAIVPAAMVGGRAMGQHGARNAPEVVDRLAALNALETRARTAREAMAKASADVAALTARKQQVEADYAAALAPLRVRRQVACQAEGDDVIQFDIPTIDDRQRRMVHELESLLHAAVPNCPAERESETLVDANVIGHAEGGPCGGALLVRTSLTCRRTWVEGDEDDGCGDGSCGDGCAQFNEPRPAFDVDDQWGCVRTSRSGKKSLADADDCPTTSYAPDNGFQVNNEEKPTIAEARVYWLVRGGDVILLHDFGEVEAWYLNDDAACPSDLNGTPVVLPPSDSSDPFARVDGISLPLLAQEATLNVAVRIDHTIQRSAPDLPPSFEIESGVTLTANSDTETWEKPIPAGRGDDDDNDDENVRIQDNDGRWRLITPDHRTRLYADSAPPSSFAAAVVSVNGLILGDDHTCVRSGPAPRKDNDLYTEVGALEGGSVVVEGNPQPGRQKIVFWISPANVLWRCVNRAFAPWSKAVPREEPWKPPHDKEFNACFNNDGTVRQDG